MSGKPQTLAEQIRALEPPTNYGLYPSGALIWESAIRKAAAIADAAVKVLEKENKLLSEALNNACASAVDDLADALSSSATTPVVVGEQAGSVRQAVRIKPLVWDDLGDGRAYRAKAPLFGSIRVEAYYSGGFHVLWSVPGFCDIFTPGLYASAELAQAAAQADYAARITAALEPDPTPALGWKAMQTAAELAVREYADGIVNEWAKQTIQWAADYVATLPGPSDAQALAEALRLPEVQAMVEASKWIGVVAQTTGGTAGPDLDLIKAIDGLAAALAKIGGAA